MLPIIRPIRESDLALVRPSFQGDDVGDQAACLHSQENGEGLYLILWLENVPAGHLYLRWAGSHEIPRIRDWNRVAASITDCPSLDDLWVRPEYRSQGIGTQLIREAERVAYSSDFLRVCLTVNIENVRAKALYGRLGYSDPGVGPFQTSGTYINAAGEVVPWDNGTQLLLMKTLVEKES